MAGWDQSYLGNSEIQYMGWLRKKNGLSQKGIPAGLHLILLLIPIIYACLSIYCFQQTGPFYTSYPDSIYIYLVNGINIASGNFNIGHYDNPGTPVHTLAGIIIFITHLFVGKENVTVDALSNPEFYLKACVIVMGILLLFGIYKGGELVLKNTSNIYSAFLFQLMPLSAFFLIHYLLLVRMAPENLIIACLIYYYSFLWVLCLTRTQNPESRFSKKNHIIFFAFISALMVTTKITCIPLVLLPLFLIKDNSARLRYLLFTFIFGALLLMPVWPQLREMYYWFKGLATHTGIYGQGKEGLIDKEVFLNNLVNILRFEAFFTCGYFILFISIIAGFVLKKWQDHFFKLVFAFWLVCSLQLILAAKHYGLHYLIASQLMIIPGILALTYVFFPSRVKVFAPVFLCITIIWLGIKTNESLKPYEKGNDIYRYSQLARQYDSLPRIITTGYQGSSFPESALRFGAVYGGPKYQMSNYYLKKLYPRSYFYDMFLNSDFVKWWDVKVLPEQLFENSPRILVYFIRMEEGAERRIINNLVNGRDTIVKSIELIQDNKITGEHFYMMNIDTAKAKPHYSERKNYFFDFEKKESDNKTFISSDGNFSIGEPALSSHEKYYSGSTSLKLRKGQYACCTVLPAKAGDAFNISVKCNFKDRPVGITLTCQNPAIFDNNCETIIDDDGKGWKTVSLKTIIPAGFKEDKVQFCLYYFGKKECFVDDLDIRYLKK